MKGYVLQDKDRDNDNDKDENISSPTQLNEKADYNVYFKLLTL